MWLGLKFMSTRSCLKTNEVAILFNNILYIDFEIEGTKTPWYPEKSLKKETC